MADAHGDLEPSRTDLTTMRGAESTAGLEATGPPFILSWVDLSDDDVTRLYDQLADRTPATTAQDRACLAADPADIAAILQKIPAVQRFLPQVSPRHGALSDVVDSATEAASAGTGDASTADAGAGPSDETAEAPDRAAAAEGDAGASAVAAPDATGAAEGGGESADSAATASDTAGEGGGGDGTPAAADKEEAGATDAGDAAAPAAAESTPAEGTEGGEPEPASAEAGPADPASDAAAAGAGTVEASDPNVEAAAVEKRRVALLGLLGNVLVWAYERKWPPEKTSTLFTIVRLTHEYAMADPHRNVFETFEQFKTLLGRHNVQRPGHSEAVFTLEDSSAALEYMLATYFRHFMLYRYIFTPAPRVVLKIAPKA